MSTKIHNGYCLPEMSVRQLNSLIRKLRILMGNRLQELVVKRIAKEFTNSFDRISFGKVSEKEYYEMYAEKSNNENPDLKYVCDKLDIYSRILEHTRNSFLKIYRTQGRNPDYDFQFSVSFIYTNKKILVWINTEKQEYTDLFLSITKAKPYGWWDNTDKPKNVSEKEWNQRERDWKKATNDFGPISTYGLHWNLADEKHFPLFWLKKEMLLFYFPTMDQRAMRIAKDRIIEKFCKEYRSKNNITEIKSISDSGIFKAADHLASEKGKAQLLKEMEKKKKFLRKIALKELEMSYNDVLHINNKV